MTDQQNKLTATVNHQPGRAILRSLGKLLLVLFCAGAFAALYAPAHGQTPPRWATLPPTPPPVPGGVHASVKVNGINLYYTDHGVVHAPGVPVILLHGGLANSDYLGLQVRALAPHHRVLAIDSRGHGRSSRDARPFGYDLMADDVIALMDRLHISRADIVGWSDGAIIGLDLAIRYPARVRGVLAFAANTRVDGTVPNGAQTPTFARFIQRAGNDYRHLSPTPGEYRAFVQQISQMWETQPNWTDAQLAAITARVLVADGDHDEAIRREHTEYIARTIPGAGLLILPNTSHFAFLQDPTLFNEAILDFLDSK